MRKSLIQGLFCSFLLFCPVTSVQAVTVSFIGSDKPVISVTPEKSTGLDMIFVISDISPVTTMEIKPDNNISGLTLSKYSNLGGGFAQEVATVYEDGLLKLKNPEGNMGYILNQDGKNYCFWVIDYKKSGLPAAGEAHEASVQECDNTELIVSGGLTVPVHYYTINGQQRNLDREIEVSYTTLEWDDETKAFVTKPETRKYSYLPEHLVISPAIYCPTEFKIIQDKFLKSWHLDQTLETGVIQPNGVDVRTYAEQNNLNDDEESNMIKGEDSSVLGGSAPADITFYGCITDAVLHTEWQMASDPEFEYIQYRFNEQDLNYTFEEEGQYYLRFVGSNADGSCEAYSDTYTVSIGASDLRIPNVFSPDGDGVNDIWKVGYRSLLEFKCWIFDRNGNQLYYFDDPQGGWDGKYRGKTVNTGVYYYVIEARGADGKKYKKGGDINILKYKKIGNPVSGPTE